MPFHNAVADFLFGGSVEDGSALRNQSSELVQQQLTEARAQEAEWERVYGPIQAKIESNLRNMTVASVSAAGLQGIEQEFTNAAEARRSNIARRGLEGSGLEQILSERSNIDKAEAKAKVRADAPEKIANAQSKFLSLGLGQKNQQSLSSRILGQQAQGLRSDAQLQDQLAAQDTGNLGSLLDVGIRGFAALQTGGASEVVLGGET